ncbi:DUF6153 family protein [Streptomyces sp. NPDC057686]|uniref:DUF6153 family protein n=1 Tax=Streptomyces sp. NPDC057686 TaxID=3346212 RepID=UPI003689E405
MTRHEPRAQPRSRPVPRLGPLLVLALLIGLLGMHGLGASAALPATGVTVHVSHQAAAAGPLYPWDDEQRGPVRDPQRHAWQPRACPACTVARTGS